MLKAVSVASQIVSEESPLFESVALSDTACSADTQEAISEEILPSTALSGVDWRIAQIKDQTIALIIQQLKTDVRKPAPQVLASRMYDARYCQGLGQVISVQRHSLPEGDSKQPGISTVGCSPYISGRHFQSPAQRSRPSRT